MALSMFSTGTGGTSVSRGGFGASPFVYDSSGVYNPSPFMGSFGNMVSESLGGKPQSYNPFAGTSLDRGFGQGTFSNLPDYSSTFASALGGSSSGSRASGGSLQAGGLPRNIPGGARYQPTRGSSGSRISQGAPIMLPGPTPVEFSLGPAPTLEQLNLDYETLGRRAMQANVPFAEQYRQFAPQTEAGTRALSQAGATMATGALPRDVTAQVGRGAAQLGFQTGLGGRSGIGRNILARDLGLSSLQVQQQGADLLAKSSALAQQAMQAMAPIGVGEVFGTAANVESINQQIRNQNLLNAWLSRPLPGQFDVTRGQYVGFQPGTYSATRPQAPGAVRPGMLGSGGWTGSLAQPSFV